MKRLIYTVVFALVCGAVIAQSEKKAESDNDLPAPVAIIDKSTYDAGKVLRGELVTHVYIVKNMGDADLIIENVKPG